MLLELTHAGIYRMPRTTGRVQTIDKPRGGAARANDVQANEAALVAGFTAWVTSLGPLSPAPAALQARVLEAVKILALNLDMRSERGSASGYARRVLHEAPDRWSLAAIILRRGQQTHPHDHGGWGCAVTVQGLERDRRFTHDASGSLVLSSERDYPPGSGYIFDPVVVHQPTGYDPQQVTVALHFLAHNSQGSNAYVEHRHDPRIG